MVHMSEKPPPAYPEWIHAKLDPILDGRVKILQTQILFGRFNTTTVGMQRTPDLNRMGGHVIKG